MYKAEVRQNHARTSKHETEDYATVTFENEEGEISYTVDIVFSGDESALKIDAVAFNRRMCREQFMTNLRLDSTTGELLNIKRRCAHN